MEKANKRMTKVGKRLKCAAWIFLIIGVLKLLCTIGFLLFAITHPGEVEEHTGRPQGMIIFVGLLKLIVFGTITGMSVSVLRMVNKKCPHESKRALRRAKFLIKIAIAVFIVAGIAMIGYVLSPDHEEERPHHRREGRFEFNGKVEGRPMGKRMQRLINKNPEFFKDIPEFDEDFMQEPFEFKENEWPPFEEEDEDEGDSNNVSWVFEFFFGTDEEPMEDEENEENDIEDEGRNLGMKKRHGDKKHCKRGGRGHKEGEKGRKHHGPEGNEEPHQYKGEPKGQHGQPQGPPGRPHGPPNRPDFKQQGRPIGPEPNEKRPEEPRFPKVDNQASPNIPPHPAMKLPNLEQGEFEEMFGKEHDRRERRHHRGDADMREGRPEGRHHGRRHHERQERPHCPMIGIVVGNVFLLLIGVAFRRGIMKFQKVAERYQAMQKQLN